ncbi:sulfite exporter TauE/SafE family protein [Actinomyces sp. B33]|nr:sulfite exporter TauE/SafE family protein [Actinomyces sp. B33]
MTALTGVVAGLLSGLFGVGGGLVIIPALVAILGMEQRRASATSLAATVLTATAGSTTYAAHGQVSLVATLVVALGSLVGAQIGVRLLRRLPNKVLSIVFVAFVGFVIVSMQLQVPVRDAPMTITPWACLGMVVVGLVAGIFAGLVGVGGGSIIVPGLELVVGAGDLLARGTSLLVMIPTGVTGTISNARHRLVDLRTALIVGGCAAALTPVGRLIAAQVSPRVGSLLFSGFLLIVVFTTLRTIARAHR